MVFIIDSRLRFDCARQSRSGLYIKWRIVSSFDKVISWNKGINKNDFFFQQNRTRSGENNFKVFISVKAKQVSSCTVLYVWFPFNSTYPDLFSQNVFFLNGIVKFRRCLPYICTCTNAIWKRDRYAYNCLYLHYIQIKI